MRFSSFMRQFASLSIVAMMVGGPSIALADTTIDFTINAVRSSAVCSVTASAGGSVDVHRISNGGSIPFWEPITASGPLTLTFDSTGEEGDRTCYSTASNTDFTNADGTVTLMYASSLSMALSTGGSTVYIGQTAPRSFLSATNIPTGGTTFDLTWYINTPGPPNPDAPVGSYTSTMTITLSSTDI